MRIGELAKRSGLSRDTIRFYERRGLLRSVASSEASNSYRDYREDLVERLAMIGEAQEAGMRIADLQQLTALLDEGGPNVDGFLDEKIAEVRRTIERANRFLSLLEITRAALKDDPVEWR